MLLSHHRRERLAVLRVRLAELAVLVWTRTVFAIARRLRVLAPEQLHRDAGTAHLASHPNQIDRCPPCRLYPIDVCEQASLHLLLAQILCDLPREPDTLGALQVV